MKLRPKGKDPDKRLTDGKPKPKPIRKFPDPPNCPLIYSKYPLLKTTRALLKGPWGVLVRGPMFVAVAVKILVFPVLDAGP